MSYTTNHDKTFKLYKERLISARNNVDNDSIVSYAVVVDKFIFYKSNTDSLSHVVFV